MLPLKAFFTQTIIPKAQLVVGCHDTSNTPGIFSRAGFFFLPTKALFSLFRQVAGFFYGNQERTHILSMGSLCQAFKRKKAACMHENPSGFFFAEYNNSTPIALSLQKKKKKIGVFWRKQLLNICMYSFSGLLACHAFSK